MSKNRFLTRLVSGTLAVAVVAGSGLFLGGVANAADPVGSLTITPAAATDVTAVGVRTSGPCPTTANAANMLITGPVVVGKTAPDATFPAENPYLIVPTSTATFSTLGPFSLPFALTLKDAAKDRGKDALQPGEYDLTAQCIQGRTTQAVVGTFTGVMFFTSPTAYTTTDPKGGGGSTTTTALVVTPVSPAAANTVETLKATVSPAAAGSVQFKDGTTNIGGPVSVSGGTASTTTTLPSGDHSLIAEFTPTDTTGFTGSTSAAVPLTVTGTVGGDVSLNVIIAKVVAELQHATQLQPILQLFLRPLIYFLQILSHFTQSGLQFHPGLR